MTIQKFSPGDLVKFKENIEAPSYWKNSIYRIIQYSDPNILEVAFLFENEGLPNTYWHEDYFDLYSNKTIKYKGLL